MLVYRTRIYLKRCQKLLSAEDMKRAEETVINAPSAWPVISGSGGIRKARVARDGIGKSGGARVIFFWMDEHQEIYFLTIYPKNEQENLSRAEINQWREFTTTIRKEKNNAHKNP